MKIYVKYIRTVIKHKYHVFKFMAKAGLPVRGILHDMSKFSITEFKASARYFNFPTREVKDVEAYHKAWLHHKARNKHHPDYWVDNINHRNHMPIPRKMPFKYAVEMLCDWLGAGIVYGGDKWTVHSPTIWYETTGKYYRLHPITRDFVERVLNDISSKESLDVLNYHNLKSIYELCEIRNKNEYI